MRVPGGIRTRNPGKEAAAIPRLRPRGHRDRQKHLYNCMNLKQNACHEVTGDPHGNECLNNDIFNNSNFLFPALAE
jgi:hypothetical protein